MKKIKLKTFLAGIMVFVLLTNIAPTYMFAAADTYYPLAVTGFNADVVADGQTTAALNGVSGVDNGEHAYYSSAVTSNGAFPSGQTITTSSGKKFKLRNSTEANSLRLTSGNRNGTLTLETPGVYSKLAVIVTGGGGQSQANVKVIYTDNTESATTLITAYDWYSGHSSKVYSSLYRIRIGVFPRGSIDQSASSLFEYVISGIDTNKTVKAVQFTWVNNGSAVCNVFALSGVIAADDHIHNNIAFKKWTATDSLPTEAGNYVLTSDVTISSTWNVPSGTVNLCLNDHRISYSGSTGSVFTINSGAVLNIHDCGTTTRYYYIDSNYLGVVVNSKTDAQSGNAERNGSFTGGYITGGKGARTDNDYRGGAVFVNGGTINMYGGTFIGNKPAANCGAIYARIGNVAIHDGASIIGNAATGEAGGILIQGQGKLVMDGGLVADNTVINGHGGGITVIGKADITGGKITGNLSTGGGSNGGGGVSSATDPGNLTIGGNVEISGNRAEGYGGGVYAVGWGWRNGSLSVSGSPVITGNEAKHAESSYVSDNLYLTTSNNPYFTQGKEFILAGALTENSKIGISMESPGVFTGGWSTNMSGKDPADYFTSDNSTYIVITDSNGEAMLDSRFVASITSGSSTTEYLTISDALSNWSTGSTLKLLKDVTTSTTINVPSGEHTLDLNGHGIKMTGNNSVFTVSDGAKLKVSDSNTETVHKFSVSGKKSNGAGFATVNDSLTSGYDTFTGGYITGGTGTSVSSWNEGGAFYITGAVEMYGGTVIGNGQLGTTHGGAFVTRDSGTFKMYGGTIRNNAGQCGGATRLKGGSCEILGGKIINNIVSADGAGIHVGGSIPVILKDCEISGNYANNGPGAGIWMTNTGTVVSGKTVIQNNLTGSGTSNIEVGNGLVFSVGELTEGAKIGVRMNGNPGVFTSGWKTNMSGKDPADYFTSDNSNHSVHTLKNGEIYMGPPHTHNWTYNASGDTITATCQEYESGLCDLDIQTITVNATGKVYDGTAVTATLTKSDDWKTENGLSDPTISYSGNTDAGTYTASITLGTATASTEFTINEISMANEVSAENYTGEYDGKAHTISVTKPSAATVKYGTESGTYDLSEAPKYTDAGTYTIYYQVTRKNYVTVTDSATVTINKINAVVTITGHNGTADYDGEEHTVTGYEVSTDSELYDVTKDFAFSGTDEVKRTDAGLTNMGLKANQFTNTNSNFTVTFDITDGYIKVDPIDVTVTITGHTATADYNGNAHSADGYDAEADSSLYDVTKDFVYNGRAQAVRTDAGISYMNLDYAKFENINPNFATVAFNVVKDGYLEVYKVDAVITKKPARKSKLVYNGSKQELVTAGTIKGATIKYAIGKNDKNAPSDAQFKAEVPSAEEIGNYYIWFRADADSNHNSLAPACMKVTLADKDWVTVSGTVYNDDEKPQSGAEVTITSGNKTLDKITTDESGEYYFTVPAGVYNIVTSYDGKSQTTKVELLKDKSQNIDMLSSKTESIVKVNSDNDFGVVVDGLNEEAQAIRKTDKLNDSQSLSLVMTVEAKTIETAKNSNKFNALTKNSSFEFFDISLEKTVDSEKTVLNSSQVVLEIAVPYDKMNRKDIAAYYCDGSEVKKLKKSNSREAGTYRIDKENGIIYIYSKEFATFAIGYTPYYQVDSSLSLGTFKGNATVVIKGLNGEGTYTLKNVSPDKLSFDNIPKGEYEMTVTWVDGVENTLTVDVTVA